MLNRLKRRFVIIGTSAVFVFLFIIVAITNIINYNETIKSIDNVMDVVSKPNAPFFKERTNSIDPREFFGEFLPKNMSPEVPYETRFFITTVGTMGNVIGIDNSRIITINDNDIVEYVERANKQNTNKGFVDNFRYKKTVQNGLTQYVFVDSGRKLESFYTVLKTSCLIALLGCVFICIVFIAVSGKVVSPIVNSYEKQKSFITNAGHELKTPLTIMMANAELIEADYGKHEAIDDIKKQTSRLKELTNNLVYLSKMEENSFELIKVEFPFSDLVKEVIDSFNSAIISKSIILDRSIEPLLSIIGDQTSMQQALSVLIENAIKYTPNDKEISIKLYSKSKKVYLEIENDTENVIDKKELNNIFERFYRMDKSRNSSTGGHGLGLSIAKTIVEANNGKIIAKAINPNRFLIKISFKKESII